MSPWVFLLAHVSFPSAGALPDLRIALCAYEAEGAEPEESTVKG